MLTDVIRVLVNNLFKKSFYEKRKKTINVLITFFISHKNDVKTFLKLIINYCQALVNIIHIIISPKKKRKKREKKKKRHEGRVMVSGQGRHSMLFSKNKDYFL